MTSVLVIDDFEPFRRFVRLNLQNLPDMQIIGEASDGTEAIQMAANLRPDVILLDIGLPFLDGLEVSRRIHRFLPLAKILFVTQESSPELVEAALDTGACGYVVKSDAGGELLTAVNALLRGDGFVGKRFAEFDFAKATVRDSNLA
jgi:DNA-binding NarL/FixJ family response regulator